MLFLYNFLIEGLFSKEHRFPGHYGLTIFRIEGAEKDCRLSYKYLAFGAKVIAHISYGIALFILLAEMGSESWFISSVTSKHCTDA